MQIIVKNYNHINRSLPNWDSPYGKVITSKAQYENECKKAGMIKYEDAKIRQPEKFSVSKETREILKSVKASADKKGNVKLSDRQIDAMKKNGMVFGDKARVNAPTTTGGFKNE